MFFSLAELEHHPILFDVRYTPGEIDLTADYRQVGEIHAEGKATLLRNTLGEIRVQGRLKASVEADCDRCLERASHDVDAPFDMFYRPVVKAESHGEIHLEEGEVDIGFYEGEGLGLEDTLREFILLSIPMQVLCKPDCAGLCPQCGANRNLAPCECQIKLEDPRWDPLKKLI
jgi:uncharacterized protein